MGSGRAPESGHRRVDTSALPGGAGELVQGRYRLLELIGKGGSARVYRARDVTCGADVALKQLAFRPGHEAYSVHASLLELEFRTLSQLSHPSIIEVYDFRLDDGGPFYTMELLEGGDLRQRAPLRWEQACEVVYCISSALALLHSRRLVHRDVTPNNVRYTRGGRAKLIDFGAMVPMGAGSPVVGTPPFMAPEVVLRSNLDARTDLFSLGATLYYALTRAVPYAGKLVGEVAKSWASPPLPPSRRSEVPEALDALVLSLLSVEPSARPRTTFEVMERLAALSGGRGAEAPQVSRAYLSTPSLFGRDVEMSRIAAEARNAFATGGRSILVEAAPGLGRSRLLDASLLFAKTLGARVLRGSSALGPGAFRLAQSLAEQLVQEDPNLALAAAATEGVEDILFERRSSIAGEADSLTLRDFRSAATGRYALQTALSRWLLRIGETQPLTVAVDDVHRIDEPSAALIAALSSELGRPGLFIISTAELGAEPTDGLAFDVLARNSERVPLQPLSRDDNTRLFESVFGDVPNVGVVSERIHAIAGGNPRDAMELAQHLCDRGMLTYERGTWTLPSRLDPNELPVDVQRSMQARILALSPLSRWLAEAQALATTGAFTRDDYAKLRPDAPPDELDSAIGELVSGKIVTTDGRISSLAHRGWATALLRDLGTCEAAARHRALIGVYDGRLSLGVVHHALLGGLDERALDELAPILPKLPEATNLYELSDLGAVEVAELFGRALRAAEAIGRSPFELNHLRRWLAALSVVSDDKHYFRVAPDWLARLKLDSGYTDWETSAEISDRGERLSRAMQAASARYAATPEAERVHTPEEAVRGLAHYVGVSLAIGSSRLDLSILESLPELLEPFAPVSPLVDLIWQNAVATRDSSCHSRLEKARERWLEVHARLGQLAQGQEAFVGVFHRAVAYALGSNEASMGVATAAEWAETLDGDPVQRVNGLYLRRVVRLQEGDIAGAEACRKEAELVALRARARQMFTNMTGVELLTCGIARDLTGVRRCRDRLRVLASRSPSWIPFLRLADGWSGLCSDDLDAARRGFEAAYDLIAPSGEKSRIPTAWCWSAAGLVETLAALGDLARSRSTGEAALDICRSRGIGAASHGISRALAVTEAKLGDIDKARSRVDEVIRQQVALGVTRLHLGASYEARARVAISGGDRAEFDRYAALTAREYRRGRGSALDPLFERLLHEAAGIRTMAGATSRVWAIASRPSAHEVAEILDGSGGEGARSERALRLVCDAARAPGGHLYLVSPAGVKLVASYRASAPPRGLQEFVRVLAERFSDDDCATEIMNRAPEPGEAPDVFVDPGGVAYRPLPLLGPVGGQVRHVGIAALVQGDGATPVDQELLFAIGTRLLESSCAAR